MKKIKQTKLKTLLALASLCTIGSAFALPSVATTPSPYSNVFMSYAGPTNANKISSWAQKNKLAGVMMWTLSYDIDPSNPKSLLYNIKNGLSTNQTIGLYFMNSDVYSLEDPAKDTPFKPLSQQSDYLTSAAEKNNVDLYYAFLEVSNPSAKTQNSSLPDIGSVYFFDPWSDFDAASCSLIQQNLSSQALVTPAAAAEITTGATPAAKGNCSTMAGGFGNFKALMDIKKKNPKVNTFITIGGFGHDQSFETLWKDENGKDLPSAQKTQYQNNFTHSVLAIVKSAGLTGVDLDYENLGATTEDGDNFLQVVEKLRNDAQAKNIPLKIVVTMNMNPENFQPSGVFADLAKYKDSIDTFQLMTYDAHGGFDFKNNPNAKTGLQTSLGNNGPGGKTNFSITDSYQALSKLGINPAKIMVGIPAYGRAVANISHGDAGCSLSDPKCTGLFQGVIPGSKALVPTGNLDFNPKDPNACDFTPGGKCQGMFSYNYIANTMNTATVKPKTYDWPNSYNGTSWFAGSITPISFATPDVKLNINSAGSSGINVYIDNRDFGYFNQQNKSFSSNEMQGLANKKSLSVTFKDYKQNIQTCPGTLDLTKNATIVINDANGNGSCTITNS